MAPKQPSGETLTFMTLLRRHRMAAGMDLSDLAKRLGVSTSAVSLWEAGKSVPRARKIPKLARVLGVSAMELTRLIEPQDDKSKEDQAVAAK